MVLQGLQEVGFGVQEVEERSFPVYRVSYGLTQGLPEPGLQGFLWSCKGLQEFGFGFQGLPGLR